MIIYATSTSNCVSFEPCLCTAVQSSLFIVHCMWVLLTDVPQTCVCVCVECIDHKNHGDAATVRTSWKIVGGSPPRRFLFLFSYFFFICCKLSSPIFSQRRVCVCVLWPYGIRNNLNYSGMCSRCVHCTHSTMFMLSAQHRSPTVVRSVIDCCGVVELCVEVAITNSHSLLGIRLHVGDGAWATHHKSTSSLSIRTISRWIFIYFIRFPSFPPIFILFFYFCSRRVADGWRLTLNTCNFEHIALHRVTVGINTYSTLRAPSSNTMKRYGNMHERCAAHCTHDGMNSN